MPLLEYQEGNTLMHRMSPVAKFAWGGIVLVWVFLMFSPIPVLILGIVIFLIAKFAAGLSLRRLLITCLKVGVLGVFILVFQGLLYPGQTVLFELGPLRPTLEGVSVGLAIALRVIAIVSASTVISKTTDPRDIFLSLVKLGVPYKIAYGVAFILECIWHALRIKTPPMVTRYAVWLMGRRCFFSAEKARKELGWVSTVSYSEGVKKTVAWLREQENG